MTTSLLPLSVRWKSVASMTGKPRSKNFSGVEKVCQSLVWAAQRRRPSAGCCWEDDVVACGEEGNLARGAAEPTLVDDKAVGEDGAPGVVVALKLLDQRMSQSLCCASQ